MEADKEILECFIDEITSLNRDIAMVLKSLAESKNQPDLYLQFSNIIDRIYGTATTLGFEQLGKYCGDLKDITRKTGNSGIQRAQQPVFSLMMNYTAHFKLLKESVEDSSKIEEFNRAVNFDIKKILKLNNDIFEYADKSNSQVK